MSIRNKILIYFSTTVIILTAISLLLIYTIFANYRKEEFHQRQKEKIESTIFFLVKIKPMDEKIVQAIDDLTIHDFYDEKLLIYDSSKTLIYASIDDLTIDNPNEILHELSQTSSFIVTNENDYDVLGIRYVKNNEVFYGISKAYDTFGFSKLIYLRNVLIANFFIISIIVIFISYYLSMKIAKPISKITSIIKNYNFNIDNKPLEHYKGENEISILVQRFNELMKKMNEAFSFQKHAIHHISHELKTPISILVSNFERIEKENDIEKIKILIHNQKEDTISLSEIISSLLEISKAETSDSFANEKIRIDELLFDVAEELKTVFPDFKFLIEYKHISDDESDLIILGNNQLLKSTFMNLMLNCVQYSINNFSEIHILTSSDFIDIDFINKGTTISDNEQKFLFQHFFRGSNSKGKRGFGLGLVLINRIISMHKGSVTYRTENNDTNIFSVKLPLS